MRRTTFSLLAALAMATPAVSQHEEHAHHASPYADQEASGIAALSATEARQLREGAGMGLARAAELNRYPGPKHVLELAGELQLEPAQQAAALTVYDEMHAAAVKLGAEILAAEERLDRRFAHRHIDDDGLERATAEIARLRGELRFVHLRAHLRITELLTAAQIERYDTLRGYR